MDSSLAILIGGTAVFAGAVGYLVLLRDLGTRRAGLAGAGTAAAVAASFLFMLYLATLALPALLGFVALSSGVVGYLVLRRDLGTRRGVLAAAGSAAVVTASFLLVVYLAVIAFIAAVGVYLLLRTRVRIAPALVLTGTTLSGLLAASVLVFWVSLTYVM
ncbi:hypothetical protein [Plantactinospora endophytica]|uniref:DUF4203 domain-containing protein n=1 Tax=Plantactinospora endophytica TaxID=673535 RepID=A0ABQ4E0A9_9ACTN|nr:hypothetical protein [Plantactinospora endophytica]GIG88169.1 hypothetical protein Pen02_31050 [Plantactinospora endophytica]